VNTIFLTNEVAPAVYSSTLYSADAEAGTLTIAAAATVVIPLAVWGLLSLRVVGRLTVTTASTDWDNTTPITGTVQCYGIEKYPGTFSQVTKPATFTLTGGVGGATVQYFKAHLLNNSQLV